MVSFSSGPESDTEGARAGQGRSPGVEQSQDVCSLTEYYKTEPEQNDTTKSDQELCKDDEPLDLSKLKTEKQEVFPGEYDACIAPTTLTHSLPQPVNVRQGSHLFPTNIETQKVQQCLGTGAGMFFYPLIGSAQFPIAIPEASMKVPTVMHQSIQGDREQVSMEMQISAMSPTVLHVSSPPAVPTTIIGESNENLHSQTENCREVQFQNGSVKIKGTKLHPEIQVGDLNGSDTITCTQSVPESINFHNTSPKMVTTLSNAEPSATVMSTDATPVPIATIPATHEMLSNMSQLQSQIHQQGQAITGVLPEAVASADLSNINFAQNYATTAAQYQMQEFQKPTKTPKSPKNVNKKSGQMKLIAENTSTLGVYTSVLKLPWSRRTRTPKAENGEKSSGQHKHLKHERQLQRQQQQLLQQQQKQQQQAQQPLMLLPVATTNLPSSQTGVFIPASNFTMPTVTSAPSQTPMVCTPVSTPPTNTQPMMMVYPNASFGSVSKPVRKRGRPPKVPVLARMLAEANKKAALDIQQMPNFFQNFPACQQSAAIVLNVNNMVNPNVAGSITTMDAVTSAASLPTNPPAVVTAPTDTVPLEQIPLQHHTMDMQQSVPVLSNPVSIQVQTPEVALATSTAHIIENGAQYITLLAQQDSGGQTLHTLAPDLVPKSQPQAELKTMTSTSVANTGALYQEMILSSKSLVNVKPRRRQTTTELLKSKSGADSFICTSFRLRSLGGKTKEKKTAVVTGMKRRGRPPKSRMMAMFDHHPPDTINQLPSQVPISDSQTISHLYSQASLESLNSPPELGQTSLDLPGTDGLGGDQCSRSLNPSQEPRLFDGAIDGNYDNPLLGNQFGVEGSLSDGCLSHDVSHGRLLFSSDDDEMRMNKMGLDCNMGSDDSSNEDGLPNNMFSKLFHCKVCNEIIPVEKKTEHWEKHSRIKINCVTCNASCYKFLTKDAMATKSEMELHKCDNCERSDMDSADVDKLSTVVHCDICRQLCPDGRTLRKHIKVEHPDVYARQKAKLLGLQKHVEELDKDHANPKTSELKIYICPVDECQKKFYSKFRIKLHMKKWHADCQFVQSSGDGSKRRSSGRTQHKHFTVKGYTCSWPGCDEQFQTERNLKVHLLLHRDEKPLKCDFCDYRCRQRTALGWHTRKHHPEASNVLMTYTQSGSAEGPEPGEENGVE